MGLVIVHAVKMKSAHATINGWKERRAAMISTYYWHTYGLVIQEDGLRSKGWKAKIRAGLSFIQIEILSKCVHVTLMVLLVRSKCHDESGCSFHFFYSNFDIFAIYPN